MRNSPTVAYRSFLANADTELFYRGSSFIDSNAQVQFHPIYCLPSDKWELLNLCASKKNGDKNSATIGLLN